MCQNVRQNYLLHCNLMIQEHHGSGKVGNVKPLRQIGHCACYVEDDEEESDCLPFLSP